jgi:repressor LexA
VRRRPITKAQRDVLNAIRAYIRHNQMPPTRIEICKAMGFKSPNAAQDHLLALERKGFICIIPNISRGIRVVRHP